MIADNKFVKYFLFPALLAMILLLIQLFISSGDKGMLAAAFFLGVIALGIFYKPKPLYRVENDGIYIKGALDMKIYFTEITEIRRISYEELGTGLRFGGRAPGMATGLFNFSSIGEVFMNSTSEERMVLIKTDNLQVIISPDEPDDLVKLATRRKYGIE